MTTASPHAPDLSLRGTRNALKVGALPAGERGGGGLLGADLLSLADLTTGEIHRLIAGALDVKADPSALGQPLAGKSVTLLFEKPSLRTRMSFEIGLTKLGAHVVYLDQSGQRLGQRESIKDYAKNLERWTDAIIARVFEHGALTEMAGHASIPVVNALSDLEHPCQALADLLTLREAFGRLEGLKLAYLGDGNNVCHSLLLAAARVGMDMTVISPRGFEPRFAVVQQAVRIAEGTGSKIEITADLASIEGHHAVYTDTWVSMGQDHQVALREGVFSGFQVDEEMMARASRGLGRPSVFMHCLPAHRGQEVTDGVIDSGPSVVYEQAENRMHAQNALFAAIFSGLPAGV